MRKKKKTTVKDDQCFSTLAAIRITCGNLKTTDDRFTPDQLNKDPQEKDVGIGIFSKDLWKIIMCSQGYTLYCYLLFFCIIMNYFLIWWV